LIYCEVISSSSKTVSAENILLGEKGNIFIANDLNPKKLRYGIQSKELGLMIFHLLVIYYAGGRRSRGMPACRVPITKLV
jgi:hypothetical protein